MAKPNHRPNFRGLYQFGLWSPIIRLNDQRSSFGWSWSRSASAFIWNQRQETTTLAQDKDLKPRHSFPSFHFHPLSIIIHTHFVFHHKDFVFHSLFFCPKFSVIFLAFWSFRGTYSASHYDGSFVFSLCHFLSLLEFCSTMLKFLNWASSILITVAKCTRNILFHSLLEIEQEYIPSQVT